MYAEETKFFIALLIAALVLALLLLFFIITIVQYHSLYRKQSMRQLHAEMDALENERKRIASDLHDDIGPLLSIVKMQVSSFKFNDAGEEIEVLADAEKNVSYILDRVKSLNTNLLPYTLLRNGLIAGLHEIVCELNKMQQIHIVLRCTPIDLYIPKSKELPVFRIIQELVTNALKHSMARELDIIIELKGNELEVVVCDDGKGFDKEKAMLGNGLGLKNVTTRVALLKGALYLQPKLEGGTHFLIKLPV